MSRLVIACVMAAGVVLGGCKDKAACEESRFRMEKTWSNVKNTAAHRKVPAGHEELTEAQKQARLAQWSPIEAKAETLRSSFETTQITWDAADKARSELAAKFKEIPADSSPWYDGFARELDRASKEMDAFATACR